MVPTLLGVGLPVAASISAGARQKVSQNLPVLRRESGREGEDSRRKKSEVLVGDDRRRRRVNSAFAIKLLHGCRWVQALKGP